MSDQMPPDEHLPPEGQPSADLPPVPGDETLATPPPRRKRGAIVALVVALALVVAGSAAAFAYFKLRGAPGAVLDKVPAGADVVMVAHLDPAASQKANLFRMTSKLPDLGSREELTQKFNEMVDQALEGSGLTHDDFGWIGGEVGGFANLSVGMPTYAVVLAVDDEGAAKAALQQIRDQELGAQYTSTAISGVEVWVPAASSLPATAVFDGVAVVASDENTMRSVIDTANGASSIEDDPVFQGVMDRLPDDNLGIEYVNVHELIGLINSIPAGMIPNAPSMDELAAFEGAGISVTAEPDGLAIDTAVTTDPSKLTQAQREALTAGTDPNPLLSLVPADAYAVLAANSGAAGDQGLSDALDQIGQMDPAAAQAIRRFHVNDLLSHLTGDVSVQVAPGSGMLPVSGTALVGIDDADAVSAWLDRYVPLLLEQGDLPGTSVTLTTEKHDGVTITSVAGAPTPLAWAVLDHALVVGLSPADVAKAIDLDHGGSGGITSDPGYTSAVAKVPGTATVLYVDVEGVLSTMKGFLPAEEYQAFLDNGGRDIEPIQDIVAGGTTDENGSTVRILIEIP